MLEASNIKYSVHVNEASIIVLEYKIWACSTEQFQIKYWECLFFFCTVHCME